MGYLTVLAYAAGLMVLLVFAGLFLKPIRVVMKLVLNTLLGALALFLANLIGGPAGFRIALNVYTAFIVGVLGIPGFVLLVILKLLFGIV